MKAILVWWLMSGSFAVQAYPEDEGPRCALNAMSLNSMTKAVTYRCVPGLLWVPA